MVICLDEVAGIVIRVLTTRAKRGSQTENPDLILKVIFLAGVDSSPGFPDEPGIDDGLVNLTVTGAGTRVVTAVTVRVTTILSEVPIHLDCFGLPVKILLRIGVLVGPSRSKHVFAKPRSLLTST